MNEARVFTLMNTSTVFSIGLSRSCQRYSQRPAVKNCSVKILRCFLSSLGRIVFTKCKAFPSASNAITNDPGKSSLDGSFQVLAYFTLITGPAVAKMS